MGADALLVPLALLAPSGGCCLPRGVQPRLACWILVSEVPAGVCVWTPFGRAAAPLGTPASVALDNRWARPPFGRLLMTLSSSRLGTWAEGAGDMLFLVLVSFA